MKRDMDTIQFESRKEIESIMNALNKYVQQNPDDKDNVILKEFSDHLDVMHMEW